MGSILRIDGLRSTAPLPSSSPSTDSRGNDGDSAGVFEMATGGKGEDVLGAGAGADLGTEYVHVGAISTRSSSTATRVSLLCHCFADCRAPGRRDGCVKENESIKSCEQYLHSGKHCIDSYVIGGVATNVLKGMDMVYTGKSVLLEVFGFVSSGEVLIFPLDAVEAVLYDISEAFLSVRYILNHRPFCTRSWATTVPS